MKRPYNCGLGPALQAAGGKWKVPILWELYDQPLRFGELKRRVVGISEKMLIQQLRELEHDAIVTRTVFQEVPPKVEYAITPLGLALCEALAPLAEWGAQYEMQRTGSVPQC